MEGNEEIQRLRTAVASGAAVCLVGAGFSRAGRDSRGRQVPSTEGLTQEIKDCLQIDSNEAASLGEIAEYASDSAEDVARIRQLLLARLTVTSPSEEQARLISLPWRAIFTTNFDDIIERADSKKRFTPVTPSTDTRVIRADQAPVYYMHGRALDLLERDIDPALVISELNYLQLDRRNRDLYARFFNEVFCARLLVIVGYSVKDLEIARGLLSRSSVIKEKTIIICAPTDGQFAQSRLAKFGTVLPIGLEGLATALASIPEKATVSTAFQFLEELTIPQPALDVTGEDFIKLILLGQLNLGKYLAQIHGGTGGDQFCVDRSGATDIVLEGSERFVRRFIVSSDFGNGKSIFLSQLALKAIERGYRVAFIQTKLAELFTEIDAALASGDRFMFILDDVVRYREVARYNGARITNNVTLVCTTRGDQDERAYEILAQDLGGAVRHVDLNALSDAEIAQWDKILERWGHWENRIALSPRDRREFIRVSCGAENRSVILSLFRTSQIAERIDRIVDFFLRSTRTHLESFAALLISSLGQRHVSWESLVVWLDIDEGRLRSDLAASEIADLFQGGRKWNAFTSPQLAEFILRNRFLPKDRDVLVSVYSRIVLNTADSANDSRSGLDFRENLKELMKFRFLTRLFGDDENAVRLINSVYKRLSDAPRIRSNPQFWLQYAMSRMEVNDLRSGEAYLNTALGLANERGKDYSPFQILDQRARLYIKKNVTQNVYNRTEVRTAISDLGDLSRHRDYEIIYPFRAVPLIRDFLEEHIDDVEPELRKQILAFLEGMKSVSEGMMSLPRAQKGETKFLYKALSEALLILRNA